MRSVDFSSTFNPKNVVKDPDLKSFTEDTNRLQMTASSRFNSDINLDRIDETRGSIAVVEIDLLVNDRNFHREKHAHHSELVTN